jgi:predicted AAA+ superfamily ATPase
MFKRINDVFLDRWLNSADRRPLILRGARQIGKSTAVRRLAERQKRRLIEIDLERHKRLDQTFATLDVDLIIEELQIVSRKKIDADCVLFLDEAQGAPHSLAALRYFFENRPELPVIAAGSLLEFALEDLQFSVPVGRVEFSRMYPVTFLEYLEARDAKPELRLLNSFVSRKINAIPQVAHEEMMKLFAEYVLVGGMPGAVAASLAQDSIVKKLLSAARVHQRLIEAFRDDFAKYRKRLSLELLHTLFDAIPSVVGSTRVKYTGLCPNERAEVVKKGLSALISAGLVSKIIHTPARGIPIASGADSAIFKLLPLDVGMSSTRELGSVRTASLPLALFSRWETGNPIERRWMGQLAECIVGQSILAQEASGNALYYWLREGQSVNAEIDYIVQSGTDIVPIEVKSGASGSLKSLHQFVAERDLTDAVRFDINPPSSQNIAVDAVVAGGGIKAVKYRLHNLPIYLVDLLFDYVESRWRD